VTNEILDRIASLKSGVTFLDISWANRVTDEGLTHFENKTLNIQHLNVNGLTGISSKGLGKLL